jgi:dolichol-phosphate mannosyltransferase
VYAVARVPDMKLTVVLPAYNEAENLPALLERIGSVFADPCCSDPLLIVVDDGSTDDTAAIVQAFSAAHPVELIRHERNRGLGRTLRTGLLEASARDGIVVTMDADDSHDPAIIPTLVRAIEAGNDVVIASRFQPGGGMVGLPAHRRLLSIAASRVMGVVFPHARVRDYSTGLRAYRSSLLRTLVDTYGTEFVSQSGFAAMVEVLLKARAAGATIDEVPFVLRYDRKRGQSKMNLGKTILGYLRLMSNADALCPPVSAKQRPAARSS